MRWPVLVGRTPGCAFEGHATSVSNTGQRLHAPGPAASVVPKSVVHSIESPGPAASLTDCHEGGAVVWRCLIGRHDWRLVELADGFRYSECFRCGRHHWI